MVEHVYVDHALSGVGAARSGLANLMAAAVSHHKPFDVILVDDFYKEARFCSTNITQMAGAGQDQAERKQKLLELLTRNRGLVLWTFSTSFSRSETRFKMLLVWP